MPCSRRAKRTRLMADVMRRAAIIFLCSQIVACTSVYEEEQYRVLDKCGFVSIPGWRLVKIPPREAATLLPLIELGHAPAKRAERQYWFTHPDGHVRYCRDAGCSGFSVEYEIVQGSWTASRPLEWVCVD